MTFAPQVFNFKQKSEDERQQSAGLSYVRQESGCSQEGEAYSQREPSPVCYAILNAPSSLTRVVPLAWLLSTLKMSAKSITMCLGASHNAWDMPATACRWTCGMCTRQPGFKPSFQTLRNEGSTLSPACQLTSSKWLAELISPLGSDPSACCLQSSGGQQTRLSGPWQQSSARTAATTLCCRSALDRR